SRWTLRYWGSNARVSAKAGGTISKVRIGKARLALALLLFTGQRRSDITMYLGISPSKFDEMRKSGQLLVCVMVKAVLIAFVTRRFAKWYSFKHQRRSLTPSQHQREPTCASAKKYSSPCD